MTFARWVAVGLCAGTLVAVGCGQGSGSAATSEGGASQPTDEGGNSTTDANLPEQPDGSGDARRTGDDSGPDSATCADSAIACCCDGDVGATLVCNADGTLSCSAPSVPANGPSPFKVYYGDDCTRPCGPCTIACPDSGKPPQDAQAGDAD